MSAYAAPLRDVFFSLAELNSFEAHYASLPVPPDFSFHDLSVVLPEMARFAAEVLAPINGAGDMNGVALEQGSVTVPPGFKAAFAHYVEGGWPRLGHAEQYGGQPAPYSVKVFTNEFLQGANQSWCMYTALNDGAIKTLISCASDALIERYVPKLVSGEWLSTMCLTEPQCGSDLSLITAKAEPTEHGSYRISGTKIFISSGEHDLTDNIAHLVLAKLPNAPAGTRGISLFVVPKRLIDADGAVGASNRIECIAVEHKMGLKGSATCALAFDGAEGWLVGSENRGMQNMFLFINKSRLGAGQQAQSQIDAVHQVSLRYAHERLQGRAPATAANPNLPADPLVCQPDIQRMLMSQKAIAEGGRALIHSCAKWVDCADYGSSEQKAEAEHFLAILIPITKGCLSELASEMTDYGIQILGGHGYVSEWGLEQRVRDVRVTRIYEGTTNVQAMDLLARKILGSEEEFFDTFLDFLLSPCVIPVSERLIPLQTELSKAVAKWREITKKLSQRAKAEPALLGAVAVDYLMIAGYITLAHFWLRAAQVAEAEVGKSSSESDFYIGKLETAKFYFRNILPRISTHAILVDTSEADDYRVALKLID